MRGISFFDLTREIGSRIIRGVKRKRDLALAHDSVQSNEKSARRKADDASASSSSAASTGSDSYDVFLSFSGQDTRKTFADHLYNGLFDASIRLFRDNNELREGEKIGTNLLQAIKNSKISIPILSQNYASSKWCLQELVEMTECIKRGHVVLPIFYNVEPTHVRNQTGSFGEAFSRLSRKYPEDVEKWKVALQEVASLKGWESEKTADGHEGDLVKMVVREVLNELKKTFRLDVTKHLVGIDNPVADIFRLLDDNSSATQIVGISGMGALNQLIRDLKEKDQASNKDEGISLLGSRFKRKKVLILLDDVDDIKQIRALVGEYDWFEMGSRIIITTRSRSVLDKAEVKCKYELKGMADDESLVLFSRHAFRRDSPPCEFESLSRDVVSTTGGLPLALEVIGSLLCGKDRAFWQEALKKLQKVPHEEVQEKLRISYEALNYEEKQIFLDIACFYAGIKQIRALVGEYDWFEMRSRIRITTRSRSVLDKAEVKCKYELEEKTEDESLVLFSRHTFRRDSQIRALVGEYDWFEMRSRIRMTTRSRSVLDKAEVKYKYELEEKAEDESLVLFSRHAFRRDSPPCEFESLSHDVVSTTGGRPLALEVIGSFLCGKGQAFWQDALKKLQKVPHEKVQEKLRISYKVLNYEEKQIFLDIACLYAVGIDVDDIGRDVNEVSHMWDACNFFPKMGIETLSFMSLIKIEDNGVLKMHDQLRKLGREIVCQEDYNTPMNRSRLWAHEEALEVLQTNKGIEKVRVQALVLNAIGSPLEITTEQLETLPNLRLLEVRDAKLIGDSKSLLPKLRSLCWMGCPAFVPTCFHLEKLVILNLQGSDISEIWEGWSHLQVAKQLKVLILRYCNNLKITPDLSPFRNLERLNFRGCENLEKIHPSIGEARGLVFLLLMGCKKLSKLPHEMGKLEELKELHIWETAIQEIPACVGSLKKLQLLDARNCSSLVALPDSISHLINLSILNLDDCSRLCTLPKSIGSLIKLKHLSLSRTGVSIDLRFDYGIPNSIWKLDWLTVLKLSYSGICELSKSIGDLKNLEFLDISHCEKLSSLPSTIGKLGNLEELDASNCKNLGGEIHVDELSSLKILCLSSTGVSGFHGTFDKVSCLEQLMLDDCHMLQSLPELPTSLTVLKVSGRHSTFPQLSCLIHLRKLTVKDCPLLKSMPELPLRLLKLSVSNCGELKELPSLSKLELLSKLYLNSCRELTEIRGLEGLKSLKWLEVPECWKLSNLDGLEHLESLRYLSLSSSGSILKDDQVRGFEKLKNLESLVVVGCESLVRVDVSQLTHLDSLDFRGCCKLLEIKGLERLKNLMRLNLAGCPIDTLPDLSCLHNLELACVDERSNIPDVRGVRRAKYVGNGLYEYLLPQ